MTQRHQQLNEYINPKIIKNNNRKGIIIPITETLLSPGNTVSGRPRNKTEINDYIDYAYSNVEQIIFVKILTLYKTKTKHINTIENINIYIDFIESKIMKKESKKKFTFDVISIEFKQNNKPIIKNLYSEKNY